jgi:16S rRNA (guanine527-N7)-methyltransferase
MDDMRIILKYFPDLTTGQIYRFDRMASFYRNWNDKMNVIPRKEVNSIYEEHVLHSLAIAKIIDFRPGSRILDVGTGGGFPGIPLAILFPDCQFVLIDSMQKRIEFVKFIIDALDIENVTAIRVKVEDVFEEFDFVASRAVAAFPAFVRLVKKNISTQSRNLLPNGIIYLKGGSFEEEILEFKKKVEVSEIRRFFAEDSFRSKKVVYLPV